MTKDKRTILMKNKNFLFGKDLRVTQGEVYTQIRDGDYSSYYPVENYIDFNQRHPKSVYDICYFGAIPDNSYIDNSKAIQKAINECYKNGGGTVLVSGGIYTTTTVYLHSNVKLFLGASSGLSANKTGKGYSHNALIYAKNCKNISITGSGKLIGNGTFFGRKPIRSNQFAASPVIDVVSMRQDYRSQIRFAHPTKYGSILVLDNCRNIEINNIIFQDSPWWTLKLLCCNNVKIYDVVIWNNRNVANSDGIDITGSSDVEVSHCFISTADDGIVLKNATWCGCTGQMSNITVKDCEIMSRTNAFKIGTETTFDISDVLVQNCKFFMKELYPGSVSGISIEACDGGKIHDVKVENINMDRCTCPVFIRLGNRNRASKVNEATANATEIKRDVQVEKSAPKKQFDGKSELYNIVIENITATNIELPVIVAGYHQMGKTKYCKDIILSDFNLTYRNAKEIYDKRLYIPEYAKEYPECWRFRNLPSYGIWARHCKNLKITDFHCTPVSSAWRKEKIFKDCI